MVAVFRFLALGVFLSIGVLACTSVGPRTDRLIRHGPVFLAEVHIDGDWTIKDYHLRDGLYRRVVIFGEFKEAELSFNRHGLDVVSVYLRTGGWQRKVFFGPRGTAYTLQILQNGNIVVRETYNPDGSLNGGTVRMGSGRNLVYDSSRRITTRMDVETQPVSVHRDDPSMEEIEFGSTVIAYLVERDLLPMLSQNAPRVRDIEDIYGRWARL